MATLRTRGWPEAGPSLKHRLWAATLRPRDISGLDHPFLLRPQAGPRRICVSSGPLMDSVGYCSVELPVSSEVEFVKPRV